MASALTAPSVQISSISNKGSFSEVCSPGRAVRTTYPRRVFCRAAHPKTVLVGLVALLFGGVAAWASSATSSKLAQKYETHVIEIEVPRPLSPEDLAEIKTTKTKELEKAGKPLVNNDGAAIDVLAGVDLDALALEKAVARGKHLVEARYVCVECHGQDFGGGVMIDDPAMGSLLGPNLTSGKGGIVANYTASDWDRIVRHGVKPDGTPALMPSVDFVRMSDNELSDIIAFITAAAPVDTVVPETSLGPLGMVFMAAGEFPLFADEMPEHQAAHQIESPKAGPTAEFGEHLVAVCAGCAIVLRSMAVLSLQVLHRGRQRPISLQGLRGWTVGHSNNSMG